MSEPAESRPDLDLFALAGGRPAGLPTALIALGSRVDVDLPWFETDACFDHARTLRCCAFPPHAISDEAILVLPEEQAVPTRVGDVVTPEIPWQHHRPRFDGRRTELDRRQENLKSGSAGISEDMV